MPLANTKLRCISEFVFGIALDLIVGAATWAILAAGVYANRAHGRK
jgi:hypothetical protein